MNYNSLMNKPTINYRELIGDNTVTEVGGITEEQFNTLLSTDLSSYYTKAQIDDLFSRSYVYREKSGSIVTFDCPASVNGIDQVVSEIVAVQDLHGYDAPWVGGAGKNKFDVDYYGSTTTYFNRVGTTFINKEVDSRNDFRLLVQAFNGGTFISESNQEVITSAGRYSVTINIPSTPTLIRIKHNGSSSDLTLDYPFTQTGQYTISLTVVKTNPSTVGGLEFKDIQLESGSTATAYAPYSNICPISGWSAVNVVVSPTTVAEDGTTYTTQLKDGQGNPLTCYGGTLSNENGVQSLTLTHGYIASYNGETLPSTWISDRDVYTEGTTPTTGAEVVYLLATSQQIPQDSLSIATQEGTNNIWADSGDITVKALDKIIQG